MSILTYTIPAAYQAAQQAGTVQLFGAMLKDSVTGQIVAHVQPTRVLDQMISAAGSGVLSTVSQGFSPLGLVTVAQNHAIGQRLTAMSAQLGVMQSMQMASLAVSGLGLGVSVAGFAMVNQRLKGIQSHLKDLSESVAQVTEDRRQDELKRTLFNIRNEVDVVETLESRSDKTNPGHGAQQRLSVLAGHIEHHMTDHMEAMQTKGLTAEDLDVLWSLAAAIRLCHDMGARALYTIDDLGGASALTERQASHFIGVLDKLMPPDALARLAATGISDRKKAELVQAKVLPNAKNLRDGLHETVAAIASQSTLSRQLLDQGVRGPDYLSEVSSQTEEPLLYLPAYSPNAT